MRKLEDRPHAVEMSSEGGANQSDRNMTNINAIVAQHRATGIQPPVSREVPLFGDFTGPLDLQSHLHRITAAQEHFDALPARVRQAAGNDPVQFMAMVALDEGVQLLKDLGLVVDPPRVDDQAGGSPPPEPDAAPPAEPPTES